MPDRYAQFMPDAREYIKIVEGRIARMKRHLGIMQGLDWWGGRDCSCCAVT